MKQLTRALAERTMEVELTETEGAVPLRNWGQVYGELAVMYEGRLPD